MQFSSYQWLGLLALCACFILVCNTLAVNAPSFGISLSSEKGSVKIEADSMEMQDKKGLVIFTGNVSVIQGNRTLRAGKMVVHYTKQKDNTVEQGWKQPNDDLNLTGIDKMEVSDQVYIKAGSQVATGDHGIFDRESNVLILSGSKVVLTDGNNVATGCRLTAHMDTGKAFLESCSSAQKKGHISVIMNKNPRDKN